MVHMAAACCGLAISLLFAGEAEAQSAPIVGRWSATVDWQTAGGVYMILQVAPDGGLREHTQNHMGMAYDLSGVYRFNPATGIFQYQWTDYSPKQICMQVGCTPLPPPQRMGVLVINRVRFLNPNEFVGSSQDGSTTWVRVN